MLDDLPKRKRGLTIGLGDEVTKHPMGNGE